MKGWGAKKFGMSLETREIKLFGRAIPGFCRDIPGVPEKFEKKKLGFNFRPYKGQQLKGKIVSEFSHIFRIFPPGLSPSNQGALAQ